VGWTSHEQSGRNSSLLKPSRDNHLVRFEKCSRKQWGKRMWKNFVLDCFPTS
jgi:hypothetical protein